MSHGSGQNPYQVAQPVGGQYVSDAAVAYASEAERTTFIRKTYAHVFAAVAAFVGLEFIYFNVLPENVLKSMISTPFMIAMLIGFLIVSMVANWWASNSASRPMQYFGLSLYVVFESLIFIPMLAICLYRIPNGVQVLQSAALVTGIIFGGLTSLVFMTRADFSFMGRFLALAMFGALAAVICGWLFGFHLGMWFSVAMIVLMSGYILYDTSNILHHYHTEQYVAAALALFASVATLFWYVLRFAMEMSSD